MTADTAPPNSTTIAESIEIRIRIMFYALQGKPNRLREYTNSIRWSRAQTIVCGSFVGAVYDRALFVKLKEERAVVDRAYSINIAFRLTRGGDAFYISAQRSTAVFFGGLDEVQ